jgi:hypothetical protein
MIWIASMKTEIVLKSVFFSRCLSLSLVDFSSVHPSLDATSGHWRKSSSDRVWKQERMPLTEKHFELSRISEPLLGSQPVLLSQHILKMLVLY